MLPSSDRSISLWCIPQISGRPISSLECFILKWKLFSVTNIKIFMKPSIYLKGREGNGKEVCDLWSCAWSFSWITRKELPDGSVMLQLGNEIIPDEYFWSESEISSRVNIYFIKRVKTVNCLAFSNWSLGYWWRRHDYSFTDTRIFISEIFGLENISLR